MTLTIAEAADLVAVSPFTIRSWIARGQLVPVRPGARPSLLRESDVVDCHAARMTAARHDRLDMLWQEIIALSPDACVI